MFDPILTQLKVRTAAVQRQRFRRADNNFVIAAGDRYLPPGEERHGVVPGLNFHISLIGDQLSAVFMHEQPQRFFNLDGQVFHCPDVKVLARVNHGVTGAGEL